MRELDLFVQECQAIEPTLAAIPAGAWDRPALGQWTLAELVAHMVRGAGRVAEYLDEPVSGPPIADRLTYWHNVAADAPAVAQRAIDEATRVDATTFPQRFSSAWRASAKRAAQLHADHVLHTIKGPMRLDDYLSTRVLEMVVHHTDVCRALDRPAVSTPAAAELTAAILEGLLGDSKPHNLGRTRFIAVATGRLPSEDPRFPVLS
jgi:uncharacterized protein (TIGR03083 family)